MLTSAIYAARIRDGNAASGAIAIAALCFTKLSDVNLEKRHQGRLPTGPIAVLSPVLGHVATLPVASRPAMS